MILGVGIDQCQISRMASVLERYESRMAKRFFAGEVAYCQRQDHRKIARFAMLFAAKEAAAKALGTGFRQSISLSNLEVIHLPSGQPTLAFHGAAEQRLRALCPAGWIPRAHLSLSDDAGIASAMVVLEAIQPEWASDPIQR